MTLAAEDGFCNERPIKIPRFCRWCGGLLQLIRGRAIACPVCDQTGWWQRG